MLPESKGKQESRQIIADNKLLILFLQELIDRELAEKRERHTQIKTSMARFPFQKTLESFDFKFQPSIDVKVIRELATGGFIANADNALLLGPPGVGKTHLTVRIGMKACRLGHRTFFYDDGWINWKSDQGLSGEWTGGEAKGWVADAKRIDHRQLVKGEGRQSVSELIRGGYPIATTAAHGQRALLRRSRRVESPPRLIGSDGKSTLSVMLKGSTWAN